MAHAMIRATLLGVVAGVALVACGKPQVPDKEQPPDPQAAQAQPAAGVAGSIQAPIDKARDVEQEQQEAADRQRDEIEAAGG